DGDVRRQGARDRARVEREEVADRVRILCAVQARYGLRARVRSGLPLRVELVLEPRRQAVEYAALRARSIDRRHEARTHLAHGSLEELGVGVKIVAIELLE